MKNPMFLRIVSALMASLLCCGLPVCAAETEGTVFDVTDASYGAKGDGVTNDRAAIQAAIDAASVNGGTVLLPEGKTFLTANLILKSNVTLHFGDGAKLKQTADSKAYVKPTATGYESVEPVYGHDYSTIRWGHSFYFNYPFIYSGEGNTNVKITGNGIIEMTSGETCDDIMHICPIGFYRTDGFEISDITIQQFSSYAMMPYTCKNGLIKDVTIKEPQCPSKNTINCDGISLMNCQNIRVTGCDITAGDDALYIFTSYDDPRGGTWWNSKVPQPSKNIEIDNNKCVTTCKGFAFILWGAHCSDLTQVEVSNVYVHDNNFSSMGIWNSDPYVSGYGPTPVKDVRFERNTITKIQDNFYSTPISNMTGYPNMPTFKNEDFSKGTAYWSGENFTVSNGVANLTDGNLFEGLSLSASQCYTLSATVNGSGKLFVKDPDTGKVIKEQAFKTAIAKTESVRFLPPKNGNYQLGVSGTATVDDLALDYEKNRQTIMTEQVPTASSVGKTVHDLGTRFKTTSSGQITAVRIYTCADETGVHTVRLWDYDSKTVVAGPYEWTVEDGIVGWQEYTLPQAFRVTAGKDYMVSVTTGPDTNFATSNYGFNSPINNRHLVTYTCSGYYTSAPGEYMPFAHYRNTNYFRDVVFVSDEQNILTDQLPGGFKNDSRYALGTLFSTLTDGQITKARIYTSAQEKGDHIVKLWDYDKKTLLAGPFTWTVTSGVEGWQEYTFATPVRVTAGTKYLIDVSCSTDKYYATCTGNAAYTKPINNRDLVTYVDSGKYSANLNNMPANSYGSANYFRDVAFVSDSVEGVVDRSVLADLVESYYGKTTDRYTAASWEDFQSVVAAAKAILEKDAVTQAEINSAVSNIEKGIDALKVRSVLNGKNMLFTGDSIAAGLKDGASLSGWCGRIARDYSMANGGLSAAKDTSLSNGAVQIRKQISLYSALQYDYVILQGGTSDAGKEVPIGTLSQDKDPDAFDQSTFAGALEATIADAVKYFPNAKIGYITPYQSPNATVGKINDMADYVAMAKAVCQKWGISCLDLYNDAAVTAKLSYYSDNIHLDAAGYDATAPVIAAWMEGLSAYTVPKDVENTKHIIACVGDNITKGEMSSDLNRYSYPAQLQTLLGDDYKVLNFGWSGATVNAASGNSYFKKVQFRQSMEANADTVIIMMGAGDAQTVWNSNDPVTSKLKFKRELTLMVNRYLELAHKPEVVLATPTWALNGTRDTVYANGMLEAINEVATALNLKVIDINAATQNKNEYYSENGTNFCPNDAGYRYIAELMYTGLTNKTPVWPQSKTASEETNEACPLMRNFGKYPNASAYRLETAEDVQRFGDLIAAGNTFAGKTVYLMNDIDFTGMDFVPLGSTVGEIGSNRAPLYDRSFQGTFDGQYHVFKNVNISSMWYVAGLFPVTMGATIKNFGMDGGRVAGFDVVGSIVGYGDYSTKLENVWSSADVYAANFAGIQGNGGIASNMRRGGNGIQNASDMPSMKNVAYYGTVSSSGYCAGICAWGQAVLNAENLVFAGDLDLRNAGTSIAFIRYNGTVDLAHGLYLAEGVQATNSFIAEEPQTVQKTDFANGAAAYTMNADGNGKWTVKNGYTVPVAEYQTVKVTADGVVMYTDYQGKLLKTEPLNGSDRWSDGTVVVSAAEAKEKVYTVDTAYTSLTVGDLDGNGSLDTADAVLLMQYLVGIEVNCNLAQMDLNGDDTVSIYDAVLLLRAVSE